MNRISTILCSATLAILSASLVAERPEGKAPPKLQKATDNVAAKRQFVAQAAIQTSVMSVLRPPETAADYADRFSRVMVIPRSLQQYTLHFTDVAPGGVALDPAHLPFEVRQPPMHAKEKETVFLSGFYDDTTGAVQLYNTSAKEYVGAAEHPFIKARTPAKKR